jgi:hypothetical protein
MNEFEIWLRKGSAKMEGNSIEYGVGTLHREQCIGSDPIEFAVGYHTSPHVQIIPFI